jgi:hypothetical protein
MIMAFKISSCSNNITVLPKSRSYKVCFINRSVFFLVNPTLSFQDTGLLHQAAPSKVNMLGPPPKVEETV